MKNAVRIIVYGLTVCTGIIGAIAYCKSHQIAGPNGSGLQMPLAFQRLSPGMSESDVVALVGAPLSRSINPKFEYKSPADWAMLQTKVDTAENSVTLSAATDPRVIHRRLQLEHRTKDIWRYDPSPHVYAILRFDGERHLVQLDSGIVPQSPKAPN